MYPFSPTPMSALGFVTPGKTFSTIAPPSSKTSFGRMPRDFNTSTIVGAELPLISSSPEKER